jgi:hypothetical protein
VLQISVTSELRKYAKGWMARNKVLQILVTSELRKYAKGWMARNKGLIPGSIIPVLPSPPLSPPPFPSQILHHMVTEALVFN